MSSQQGFNGMDSQVVVFQLGDELFGIDVSQVREIVKIKSYTRVPQAPEFVEGVINLRGQITPVVNTKKLFNMQDASLADNSLVIIVEIGDDVVGLIVDSVLGVQRISKKDVVTPPSVVRSVNTPITGIAKLPGKLIILVDANKLISIGEQAGDVIKEIVNSPESQSATPPSPLVG